MSKTKRKAPPKRRNPYALIASMRSGAGSHGHPAREASRNACRKKIDPRNWDNWDEDEEVSQ